MAERMHTSGSPGRRLNSAVPEPTSRSGHSAALPEQSPKTGHPSHKPAGHSSIGGSTSAPNGIRAQNQARQHAPSSNRDQLSHRDQSSQRDQSSPRDQSTHQGQPHGALSGPSFYQISARARRPIPRFRNGRWGQVFAAIDLGTNSCRLLVARPKRGGFSVIDAFSRTVCLGEGLSATGELQPEAMDRVIEALRICGTKIRRRGATLGRAVATQACRMARNGNQFLDRVGQETGLMLDIVSPAEEARLAAMGCWPLVERSCDMALVFDIGGGSTELIWIDVKGTQNRSLEPRIATWTSLPCGVVNLTERFGTPHLGPETFAPMVEHVRSVLATFGGANPWRAPFDAGRVHLVGTSGTVTTLAGLSLGLERYERDRVDGTWLDQGEVERLTDLLSGLSHEGRQALPCVGADRADFVLAGCAILTAIQSLWPCPRLRVADRGLREGILLSLMAEADRKGPGGKGSGRVNRNRRRRYL